MAKGNLFLGHAKGKVGSIVFSRAFGQQITRTKPSSVKNPKSRAQNAQRAILASVAKAASIMAPIIDHSFAGVRYGAESVRHFRKININQLRALYMDGDPTGYNLTPKGGAVVPNSYIVSQGNLPAFQMQYDGNIFGFKMTENNNMPEDSIKVSQFLAAYPYLQGGDQLTLIKLVLTSGSLETGNAKFAFLYDRMVFAPNAFDDPDSIIIDDGDKFVRSKLDLTKTTNPEMLSVDSLNGHPMLSPETRGVYAAALILSRVVNGVWQRSTQEMGLTHESDVQDIEAAIASYGATASDSVNDEYLNQADDSDNTQSGVSSAYMNVSVKPGDSAAENDSVLAGNTNSTEFAKAAGTVIKISAVGFDSNNAIRPPFFTIFKGETQMKVHAGSIDYSTVLSADTAGVWKIEAAFADGRKAVYSVTLKVQA